MAKVYVAGPVDGLFESITVETREGEPFRAARCKACGWIGLSRFADDLPAHECSGLHEQRDPNSPPPRVPKVKRAMGR